MSAMVHHTHTLARPPVVVQGKAWVACTGVGTRHVGTQLLAVAIATFIYVWGWEGWKVEWSAFSHEIKSSKHTEPAV